MLRLSGGLKAIFIFFATCAVIVKRSLGKKRVRVLTEKTSSERLVKSWEFFPTLKQVLSVVRTWYTEKSNRLCHTGRPIFHASPCEHWIDNRYKFYRWRDNCSICQARFEMRRSNIEDFCDKSSSSGAAAEEAALSLHRVIGFRRANHLWVRTCAMPVRLQQSELAGLRITMLWTAGVRESASLLLWFGTTPVLF